VLQTLQEHLQTAEAEEQAKLEEVAKFQQLNPNLSFDAIYQQQLADFSRRFTEATLHRIELESTYQTDHPQVLKARKAEEELSRQYQDKLRLVMGINYKSADLLRLTAELDARKGMVSRLQQRIYELRVQNQTEQVVNLIEVWEPPRVADWPSFPRKNRTMAVAIAAGALIGAGLALLRDRLDGRMRSIEEIQTVIGLPILGVVPVMTGRRTAIARAMAVHLDPHSPVAESYRTIRTAVYFGANGAACRTLLITSPEPGDGKTTSASNLAIAIAQTGRSVLLLDADFRKPTQHKNLDIKDAVGLSSVLAGREPLERAIQRTGVEGLDILPCGPIPANPSEILNSREFGELVDSLASRYDHIVFDSPPVNSVTDARILGAVCDATILILRADKSTRKAGEHARNALLAVGARILGAVVNDAPHSRGYEVYGGSYYGAVDVHPRAAGPFHGSFGQDNPLSRSA
jgi:capsular exopolysaccharide synthesis family protein